MMKLLNSKLITTLLFTLSFQIENISAMACDKYNITHFQQDDTVTISFSSNNLLKLNRTVRCTSNSSIETINGCAHPCLGLGYGEDGEILIEMQHENGTTETCFIRYVTDLQEPTLAFFEVPGDRVRLGVTRPIGSFDYVTVQCSDEESYVIFNTSISSNSSLVTVDCSFVPNLPLMSFLLETLKKDFRSAMNHIVEEVPLPVPFTTSLNSLLLTVEADPPPLMNANSTYEFQLIFYDGSNEQITYTRAEVFNLTPHLNVTLNYGLIPNVRHRIIFTHRRNSSIYALSNSTRLPVSNVSYPYEITNLRVQEEFQNIIVNWNDPHDVYDPIEFIVVCDSKINSTKNVGRNTTYICENLTFNETSSVSVETHITVPNYIHDRTVMVTIDIEQVPEIPAFEVSSKTETSITIQWNYKNQSVIPNLFEYKIKCGENITASQIDIRSNEYQCQSLEEGTVYVITMFVVNMNNTIQRMKSIEANTLLQKCQYRSHFYSPDLNGTRSVIVEWSPPDKNFDKIYAQCASSYLTFEYYQVTSFMYFKCIVTSGLPFNVRFSTIKSGFEWATVQFTDTAPIVSTTTTTTTTVTMTVSIPLITTTTTFQTLPTTTTTTMSETTSTTTTRMSGAPSTTTTTAAASSSTVSDCSQDIVSRTQINLTRWRTAAIIAFIIAGFLAVSTICLIVFSVLLCLRNHDSHSDE